MHNGLTISPSRQLTKCLKPLLCLNSPDTTIWSISTENKSVRSLGLWNSFLLSIILLNCSVFWLIFYVKEKTRIYFLMLLFYTEPILDTFFFDTL